MKMMTRVLLLPAITFFGATALFAEEKEPVSLDDFIFSAEPWAMDLAAVKEKYTPKEDDLDEDELRIRKRMLKRLRETGVEMDGDEGLGGFAWLSEAKNGIRAEGGEFQIIDKKIGEVNVRGTDGKVGSISISLFNRGDDDNITKTQYYELLNEWKAVLDEKIKVRSTERKSSGAVKTTGWLWKKGDVAYLLEGSIGKRTDRAEFIRLRLASLSKPQNDGKVTLRNELSANVKKTKEGDIYVSGIPMVDQGQKGYCVVASVERVARYFGADVDQHEMAQLANTDQDGTYGDEMEKAFQKVTGKIHVRTIKLISFDDRQFERDYNTYNRTAKKEGAWYMKEDFDEFYVNAAYFWEKVNTDIFKQIKGSQNKYDHFNRKIKEYIDQGVPICWTLYLGMFKEKGLPQSGGGHMRIIMGYNEKTQEIIYTDSWGKGHEMKKMPTIEAWCMTTGLYAMVPTR